MTTITVDEMSESSQIKHALKACGLHAVHPSGTLMRAQEQGAKAQVKSR